MNIIVLGSGMAGFSAAICASRKKHNVTLLTGKEFGGQIYNAGKIDNYPGYLSTTGFEIIHSLEQQAQSFGTNIIDETCLSINIDQYPYKVIGNHNEYIADYIIIATGQSPRKLNINNEDKFMGRGISYCAICDGRLYQGKDIVVVGSGDSAIKGAMYLAKFASHIDILVKYDHFHSFDKTNEERIHEYKNIDVSYETNIIDIQGEEYLSSVIIKKNDIVSEMHTDGVFVMIGSKPNSDFVKNIIELDDLGYIKTDFHGQTNIDHIFAAGDIQSDSKKQAVIAAGAGFIAAMNINTY